MSTWILVGIVAAFAAVAAIYLWAPRPSEPTVVEELGQEVLKDAMSQAREKVPLSPEQEARFSDRFWRLFNRLK